MGHHRVLVLPMGSPPRRTATSLSLSQFRLRMPWFPPFFLLVAHVSDPSFSPRPGLTQQGCAVRLCLSSMAELNNPLPHYRLAPSLALGIIGHLKKISSSSAILHVRTCSPDCKTLARKAFQPKTKSNSVSTCAGHL